METNQPAKQIILTLENCILPETTLTQTPSAVDGLSLEDEYKLRVVGCELIQSGGILLRLPQVAMATAQVLFQRFYYRKSLVRYSMEITAMACLLLASKIEEAPREIRDVINVFNRLQQINNNQDNEPLLIDNEYLLIRDDVIRTERRILKELGFCVHVKHPHKFIVTLLQILEKEKDHLLMQTAWNYMNDSLRTDLFVRYSPETIACSCIFLSARVLKISLPDNPPWFEIFGANQQQIEDVALKILQLYSHGKVFIHKLNQRLAELKSQIKISKPHLKVTSVIKGDQSEEQLKKELKNVVQNEDEQLKLNEVSIEKHSESKPRTTSRASSVMESNHSHSQHQQQSHNYQHHHHQDYNQHYNRDSDKSYHSRSSRDSRKESSSKYDKSRSHDRNHSSRRSSSTERSSNRSSSHRSSNKRSSNDDYKSSKSSKHHRYESDDRRDYKRHGYSSSSRDRDRDRYYN